MGGRTSQQKVENFRDISFKERTCISRNLLPLRQPKGEETVPNIRDVQVYRRGEHFVYPTNKKEEVARKSSSLAL